MPKAMSSFETERAARYLQAMCRHFAHKVQVSYDAERGTAAMPFGTLNMCARDGALHFEIEADDDFLLARMKHVIFDHIARFAFREKLQNLDWRACEPDASGS